MRTDRLIELRKKHKYTQAEIASKIGIARTTYVRYESGEIQPPTDIVILISKCFDVSIDYLLGASNCINENIQKNLYIPPELKGTGIAFDKTKGDLTQDEIDKIAEFVKFVKSQRKN